MTQELGVELSRLSCQTKKEIAILVDRKGHIHKVILGDPQSIFIPDLSYMRRGLGRLKGLRCIHTHLKKGRELDSEDLMDLALLRLDGMVVIEVKNCLPSKIFFAHLLPQNPDEKNWEILKFKNIRDINLRFESFIQELEEEIYKSQSSMKVTGAEERAILVHASPLPKHEGERSLAELAELARSSHVEVIEKVLQRVKKYNPSQLIGRGKLREILINGLYLGATMVIFDQDLTPVQVNNIARMVDLKVVDRTQLILDIFARRAKSREGRIQVELAQLKYILPRLIGRGTAMSRLMGGIGGRGPGESKLEVDRRKVRDKITSLEKELEKISKRRKERRKLRTKTGTPLVSIIGYTNAGKSTLHNRLTRSATLAEDRLFATLDPTTRKCLIDGDTEILISDTVGFIRNMPKDLLVAFRATMEELADAHLFLHMVDITSPYRDEEIQVVEELIENMDLLNIPRIILFNKIDLYKGKKNGKSNRCLYISATTGEGLELLKNKIKEMLKVSPPSHNENQGI